MSALYEITEKHHDLMKLAEESEDMAEAVKDTMELIDGEFSDKAISLIKVMENIGGDIAPIDEMIARLTARKKAIQNKQASMKNYLKINMEASNIHQIKCPLFTITLAKGRDIVKIDNENEIPAEYLNIKTSMTPMKKEILAALKEGEEIKGASLTKSENSIRIK